MKKIRIGTRGSQLALWQAHWVKSQIESFFPSIDVSIVKIKTTGDRIVDRPLAMVGGKGLFVKEIETRLIDRKIDIAVHSMKDMPGDLPQGLIIGAVPQRANPFDVLISRDRLPLSQYKPGATIGTSSLRRASQIKHLRPDLNISSIRGNLDTRIRKLKSGEYDAIVLAAAGLIRLDQAHEITEYLDEIQMVPAVGQGALCIETRDNDPHIQPIMDMINDPDTMTCVMGERAFLKKIEGSCHIPVACFGKCIDRQRLSLSGLVASEDGMQIIREDIIGPYDQTIQMGTRLADTILAKGGKTILENLNAHD